jgi:glutathione S-transferase
MKLYYMNNACSLGIHVLLAEIGKPYELEKVDFMESAQYKPDFVKLNPKSKVPVLELDDGQIVTEFPAIAYYLARANPETKLLPADILGEAKALELLDYLIATVHMRGFTRIFRPEVFSPTPEDKEKVQAAGRKFIETGFLLLEPVLGDQKYILGDFSIVEGALFFLEHWAVNRAKIPLPAVWMAHYERLMARPAVKTALAAEGLT